MVEEFKGYDKWKLSAAPSEEIPHPLSCVDKIGDVVEFWLYIPKTADEKAYYKYVCGRVSVADNETVVISYSGQSSIYQLDDLRSFDENDKEESDG